MTTLNRTTETRVQTARWDLYTKCNLRCIHCYADGLFATPSHYLRRTQAHYLLDKLWDLGIRNLNLLGGEPFLHPDIYPILEYACARGFHVDITTNGTAIREHDIPRILDIGLRSIFFSVDGSCPEIHDMIRGTGAFNKTSTTITQLIQKKQQKHTALMINVNTVLTRINRDDILNIVDLCYRWQMDLFKLSRLQDFGNKTSSLPKLFLTAEEELLCAETLVAKIPKYPALSFEVISDKPLILEYFFRRCGVEFPVKVSGCKACAKEVYVDPGGRISPCIATSRVYADLTCGCSPYFVMDALSIPSGARISDLEIYEDFRSQCPVNRESYGSYTPCYRCPYLTTICYPCPLLGAKGGSHTDRLCSLAEQRLSTPEEVYQ